MQRAIRLAQARSMRGATAVTPSMIQQADLAIRREFVDVLPAGRDFTASASVTTLTPTQFAALRVPDAEAARKHIGEAALEASGNLLRRLCITSPEHPQLQSEVAAPVLGRRGINFVRDYQSSKIPGVTTLSESGGRSGHVYLQSTSRNMGHIVVHEAMHFYVSDTYYRTAKASPLEQQLMEGGAEFLARNVINHQLAAFPEFEIDTRTYASEFSYVANYLVIPHGGLSSFKLAYFQGRVDLLGLTAP